MKGFGRAARWPVATALVLRVAVWALIPGDRFASDEQGYVGAGIALATTGQQDLFWPPLTGWIVALIKWMAPSVSLAELRLSWIAIDAGNVALVAILAGRVARAACIDRADRFVTMAALAYAFYLPALSHSQFVTSEIPALCLVLAALVALTDGRAAGARDGVSGVLLGAVLLVRANLLPLLLVAPAAAFSHLPRSMALRRTAMVVTVGVVVVMAALARNWLVDGEPTLSRNAAYNLYIGNQDFYAEDLNLLHPRATAEQIEFRRQFFAGTLSYPAGTAAELQRAAMTWIVRHPAEFGRRAIGRLARVFAPKTDVLELAGGESAVGVFSPIAILLLGLANVQWAIALFAGLFGVRLLLARDRRLGLIFLATIAGSVLLCLVAIAKPRYTFVFDPLLIVTATLVMVTASPERASLWRRSWPALAPAYGFLVWGWIAWTIFAVSSRLAA